MKWNPDEYEERWVKPVEIFTEEELSESASSTIYDYFENEFNYKDLVYWLTQERFKDKRIVNILKRVLLSKLQESKELLKHEEDLLQKLLSENV